MTMFVGIVMIVVSAAFVSMPFFTAAPQPDSGATPRTSNARQRLERQKVEAYAAIKDAEFDYQMGKLSDADFAMLRDKYATQALEAIGALDAASAKPRQASTPRRPVRIAFCPSCGHAAPARANFCAGCGRSFADAVA